MGKRNMARSTLRSLFARTGAASASEAEVPASSAGSAMNPWAAAAVLLAVVLAVPVVILSSFFFIIWSAERDATNFCKSIPIDSDIEAAIDRYEKREKHDERSSWHYVHEESHAFQFPILFDESAYCDVAVNAKGKVLDKSESCCVPPGLDPP